MQFSNAVAQQASGTRHSATPHYHPHLLATTCPHQHLGSPSNSARILRKTSGTTNTWQIRVQWHPDPPQSYQNQVNPSQDPQGTHRHHRIKQTTFPMELSAPKLPLPCRTMPNVACLITRPKRMCTEMRRQRLIGGSERSKNW